MVYLLLAVIGSIYQSISSIGSKGCLPMQPQLPPAPKKKGKEKVLAEDGLVELKVHLGSTVTTVGEQAHNGSSVENGQTGTVDLVFFGGRAMGSPWMTSDPPLHVALSLVGQTLPPLNAHASQGRVWEITIPVERYACTPCL